LSLNAHKIQTAFIRLLQPNLTQGSPFLFAAQDPISNLYKFHIS